MTPACRSTFAWASRFVGILTTLLCPSTSAAGSFEIWYQDRPAGEFKVVSLAGEPLRSVPFGLTQGVQFVVAPDRRTVFYNSSGTVWKFDVASGHHAFLFNDPWGMLTGFVPGDPSKVLTSGTSGRIWQWDDELDVLSVWQDNDQLPGQFGFNTFRYELSIAGNGASVVRAGYAGAGGDALFLARECELDERHHLCDMSVLANPGGGSASWSATASHSGMDPTGKYVFYGIFIDGTTPTLHRRELATGVDTVFWQGYGTHTLLVAGQDVVFSAPAPGGGANRALYACDIESLGCRLVFLGGPALETFAVAPTEDQTSPRVTCAEPDFLWHPADIAISCTATDEGSGLANPEDAEFALLTMLPDGMESRDVPTDAKTVCDLAGNCAAAGPIAGNMIDKKAPDIEVVLPGNAYHLLNERADVEYACTDGGSGVASCVGPVPSGGELVTSTVGQQVFRVTAEDAVGNAATRTVEYTVGYAVCLAYDPTRAHRAGSTVPIRVQLCDARSANVSTSTVLVRATAVRFLSNNASGPLDDSGNANPDMNFRFDQSLGGSGGYVLNLSLKGYAEGTYELVFTAGSDPVPHSVTFQVR